MSTELKCPVCGSTDTRPVREMQQCGTCGTTDSLPAFQRPGVIPPDLQQHIRNRNAAGIDEVVGATLAAKSDTQKSMSAAVDTEDRRYQTVKHDPKMVMPPKEISDAVYLVDTYFRQQSMKHWAYGPIQSRESEPVPNLTLKTIKHAAAAFCCAVIPRPDPALLRDIMKTFYEATTLQRVDYCQRQKATGQEVMSVDAWYVEKFSEFFESLISP